MSSTCVILKAGSAPSNVTKYFLQTMKTTAQLLLLSIALTHFAFGDPPKTEAELISQYRDAISTNDAAKLADLTYREGMSEQDLAMSTRGHEMLLKMSGEIDDVVLQPLPDDFQTVAIMRGKKIEMTAPPKGLVHLKFKDGPTGGNSTSTPYTIVDGLYYLIGPKTTDLDWQGPPDKNIGFMVIGQGQDNVDIVVEWNASGVLQSRKFTEPSSTFWGQHINSVTVVSDSDDTDVKITVLENGETIHESEALKGQGKLEYKREG